MLDISDGDLWLVKTVDSATGKPVDGLVRRSCLVPKPPSKVVPVQNGMESAVSEPVEHSGKVQLRGQPPPSSATAAVMPGTLFGKYDPPQSMIFGKPQVKDGEIANVEQAMKKDTPISEQAPPPVPVIRLQSPAADTELQRLQEASVSPQVQLDEFDPVEMYVAIADFQASEESNISLKAGEHVQVGMMSCVVL